MNKKSISLISYGQFEKEFLEKIADGVEVEFGLPVRISHVHKDLSSFFDPTRSQYDANQLLKLVDSEQNPNTLKSIGLFQVDLFIPILTFVFGQAIFRGKAGIASVYRLKSEQYGLPENKLLVLERLRKVVIHELGHTFGLIHCHVPSCVMRSTTYAEEIDQKKDHFCNKCRKQFEAVISDVPSSDRSF